MREFQPRSRIAVLSATAVFGVVQLLFEPFQPVVGILLIVSGPIIAWALQRSERFFDLVRAAFHENATDDAANGTLVSLAGFLFVLVTLVFLEWRDPFFFTQDDNFSMGPVCIAAARGFLSGVFPTWNPFQFMGQPTSVQSIYGLTYPWTYVAFAFVHWLGHDNWFIEAFVVPHILGGYWAAYAAARALRVRPVLAVTAATSFILSGTVLMMSRSYSTMAPLVLWTPVLVIAAERLRRSPTIRWAAGTALAIGVFCHSGNGQMWTYAVMFFGLAIVVYAFAGDERRASFFAIAIAACLSLAISLLLIVPQMWFMQTVHRVVGWGGGIFHSFQAVILPMPLVRALHPQFWGNSKYTASYYYAGTVLTLCALAAIFVLAGLLLSCRGAGRLIAGNVWLLCALVALALVSDTSSTLWRLLSILPVFNKFTGPWKILIFFHLFAALAAAVILDRLMRVVPSLARWEKALPVIVAALLFLNAFYTRTAFYNYGEKPYPALPPQLSTLLLHDPPTTRGRVLSVGPMRNPQPGYVQSMMLDFPSYYGVASFAGYDPFVNGTNETLFSMAKLDTDTLAAARAYGLRWVLVHESSLRRTSWYGFPASLERLDPVLIGEAAHLLPYMRLRLKLPRLQVWELPSADPMAFPERVPSQPLPVEFDQTGATVDVRSLRRATNVVINILGRRGMNGYVDGAPVELSGDDWGRVVISVPPAASHARVAYEPPWGTAAQASLLALLLALILVVVSRSSGKAPERADRSASAAERR